MTNEIRTEEPGGPAPHRPADAGTRLAVVRTFAALDRTLMAWVRTATSLISFGFSIYKVFQTLFESEAVTDRHFLGPRGVALIMIALGVGGLLMATVEYRQQMRDMLDEYRQFGPFRRSPAFAVAGSIAGLGVLGFVLVVLRI